MLHPRLRLAAARFALALADVGELVDASHAVLDDAIYADGLAVIATTPGLSRWEAAPHFYAALRELGHAFSSLNDALRHLRASYFVPIAEGATSPLVGLSRYFVETHQPLEWGPHADLEAWAHPSAGELVGMWYAYEDLQDRIGTQWGPPNAERAALESEATILQLAHEWCQEYAQLLFQPAWRSETVVALASGIYAGRAFDRLPIQADALEEAGCDHPDVLAHCRCPGPHARGCWVVDLVLGKS